MKSIYSSLNKHVVLSPISQQESENENYENRLFTEKELNSAIQESCKNLNEKSEFNNFSLNSNYYQIRNTITNKKLQIVENNDLSTISIEELNEMNYREASKKDNR